MLVQQNANIKKYPFFEMLLNETKIANFLKVFYLLMVLFFSMYIQSQVKYKLALSLRVYFLFFSLFLYWRFEIMLTNNPEITRMWHAVGAEANFCPLALLQWSRIHGDGFILISYIQRTTVSKMTCSLGH